LLTGWEKEKKVNGVTVIQLRACVLASSWCWKNNLALHSHSSMFGAGGKNWEKSVPAAVGQQLLR